MRKCFFALVFLAFCPLLVAQQAMNNDSIVKLVKAGLSDDLIVSTVNASPGTYDTSADGIIALKTAGVSDKVVAAIVAKATAPPPAPATAPAAVPAPAPAPEPKAGAQVGTTATVHFYRFKEFVGSVLKPSVYCDGIQLGRLENGHYMDFQIAAGKHTFYADDKGAGATITIEAGKEYYMRAYVQPGFWKGHFVLTMVMPEQGKYETAMLKP